MREEGSSWQIFKRTISLFYNRVLKNRPLSHCIVEPENGKGGIFLGGQPQATVWHKKVDEHIKLKGDIDNTSKGIFKLGLVVGAVQSFELNTQGNILYSPVTPQEWNKQQVDYIHLPIQDFTTKVNFEDLKKTTQHIDETVNKGESVYIHCKAGRARSVLVLMSYLVVKALKEKFPDKNEMTSREVIQTINETYSYIKLKRPHIDFDVYNNANKRKEIENFVRYYFDLAPVHAAKQAVPVHHSNTFKKFTVFMQGFFSQKPLKGSESFHNKPSGIWRH